MRGRRPIPRETKQRRGTLKPSRDPGPVLIDGRPGTLEPLGRLSRPARQAWDTVVGPLVEVGLIDGVDRALLTQFAVAIGRAIEARALLERDGLIVEGQKGGFVVHPAFRIERDAVALALRLADHYGLSPVARTRLGIAELKRRSLAEELGAIFASAPAELDAPAVAVCGECGSRRGRRHADNCSRRRRPRR